jgi:hypothetical protein
MTDFIESVDVHRSSIEGMGSGPSLVKGIKAFDDILQKYIGMVNPGKVRITSWDPLKGGVYMVGKSFSHVDRIKMLLKSFPRLEIDIPFYDYDPESAFLSPVDLRVSPYASEVHRRASDETSIGFHMKFPQTLAMHIAALVVRYGKKAVLENPCFQMMAYYADTFPGELFREGANGAIIERSYDSMAPTRCLTLLRGAEMYLASKLPKDLVVELTRFLFKNPYVHQMKLKKMFGVLKQSVFSKSPIGKGYHPRWKMHAYDVVEPSMPRFEVHVPVDDDGVYYEVMKDAINEQLEALIEAGLVECHKFWTHMISAEVNEENMDMACYTPALNLMCGFARSEKYLSHKEQFAKAPAPATPIPGFGSEINTAKYLRAIWRDLIKECFRVKAFPVSEKEYLSRIPYILTSRSAGGAKVSLQVGFRSRVPGAVWSTKHRKYMLQMSFTDKTMNFFAGPFNFIGRELVLLNRSSPTNPHNIANRDTPGRLRRAVLMVPLQEYLIEGIIAPTIMDIQSTHTVRQADPLDPGAIYTVGSETGTVWHDHIHGMVASSDPDRLIVLADFSQFDSSEREHNMRQFMRQGIEEGFREMGYVRDSGEKFMGFKTFVDAVLTLQELRVKSYFRTREGTPVHKLDQLLSGEFLTLVINNVSNTACFRSFLDMLKSKYGGDLSSAIKLILVRFQGDDSFQIWKIDNERWNVKRYTDFVKLQSKNAMHAGFDLNFDKTVTRKFYYEYLKKTFIYGYAVPRANQTTMSSSETPAFFLSPVESTVAVGGVAATSSARAMDHKYLTYMHMFYWNFKRTVKAQKFKFQRGSNEVSWCALPFGAYFTPSKMKGCGRLLGTIHFPAADGLIGWYAAHDPTLAGIINTAATILDVPPLGIKRTLAKMLLEGTATYPADVFAEMKRYNKEHVMDIRKVIACKKALRRLGSKGISLGHLSYMNFSESMMEKAITSAKRLMLIESAARGENMHMYIDNMSKPVKDFVSAEFGWMKHMVIDDRKELEDALPMCPMAGLSDDLKNMVKKVGISTSHDRYRVFSTVLNTYFRKDRKFPRHVRSEDVVPVLAKPEILADPVAINDILIGIGLDSAIAAQAATEIVSNHEFLITTDSLISFRDPVINLLDFSIGNYSRVTTPVMLGDKVLNSIARQMALGKAIYECMRTGVLKRQKLIITDASRAEMLVKFKGRAKRYAPYKVLGIFKETTRIIGDRTQE